MQIGPYTITRELARGGMGVVYQAHDPRANRPVALKLLQVSNVATRARFMREVDSFMRLRHRYVVAAHDAGEHRGFPYLVLDLVEGESLQAKLRAGPLEPRAAVELTRKLAEALAYAHEQGIVHRDVKPANVLIDSQGEPRLTDFGLAKLLEVDSLAGLTKTGAVLGTPGYWAPEQAGSKTAQIGPATDIYGLGATLYAALCGRPPIDGQSFIELMVATREKRPEPPGVDEALDAICLRCLEKAQDDRYATAGELEQALEAWSASDPRATRKTWLAATAGVLVCAVLLALGLWSASVPSEDPVTKAPLPPPSAPTEAVPAEASPASVESETATWDSDERALDAKGWVDRGLAWEDQGRHSSAIHAFTRALELQPGYAHALSARGHNRYVLGDRAGAIEDQTAALMSSPKYVQAWINRGLARLDAGEFQGSLDDSSRAIQLDPSRAWAWNNRGLAKLGLKDISGALADFEQALELDPTLEAARGNRGVARQALGDLEGSAEDLGEALLKPSKPYVPPRNAVGLEKLAHTIAGTLHREGLGVRVNEVSVAALSAAVGAANAEGLLDGLLRAQGVLAQDLPTQTVLNLVILHYSSVEGARAAVEVERDTIRGKDEALRAMTGVKRLSTSYSADSGVPGAAGFLYTRRIEIDDGTVVMARGGAVQVGPYCVELALTLEGWGEERVLEFTREIVEILSAEVRRR